VALAAISGIPQNPTHSAFDSPEIESFTRAFSVAGQFWNCACPAAAALHPTIE
jgi:hypothetical protein